LQERPSAWMSALALGNIAVWEKRWRELLRWELYVGFVCRPRRVGVDLVVYVARDGLPL